MKLWKTWTGSSKNWKLFPKESLPRPSPPHNTREFRFSPPRCGDLRLAKETLTMSVKSLGFSQPGRQVERGLSKNPVHKITAFDRSWHQIRPNWLPEGAECLLRPVPGPALSLPAPRPGQNQIRAWSKTEILTPKKGSKNDQKSLKSDHKKVIIFDLFGHLEGGQRSKIDLLLGSGPKLVTWGADRGSWAGPYPVESPKFIRPGQKFSKIGRFLKIPKFDQDQILGEVASPSPENAFSYPKVPEIEK